MGVGRVSSLDLAQNISRKQGKLGFPIQGSKAFLDFEEQGAELRESRWCPEWSPTLGLCLSTWPACAYQPFTYMHGEAQRGPQPCLVGVSTMAIGGFCQQWLEALAIAIFVFPVGSGNVAASLLLIPLSWALSPPMLEVFFPYR